MPDKYELVTSFGLCYRSLIRLALNIENKKISAILSNEAELFLNVFIGFLKSDDDNFVKISNCIESALKLVFILKSLDLPHVQSILEVERNLLILKLKILGKKTGKTKVHELGVKNEEQNNPVSFFQTYKLSASTRRILDFLKIRGEANNRLIYDQFPDINGRSLRRSLNSLVSSGFLTKIAKGKRINYKISNKIDVDRHLSG